jgi:septal ring factor EnvC (AmiA/AmiB activator)
MDDPTDVEVVAEMRSCTGRDIDVVVATADALDRALSRLYRGRGDETSARLSSTEAGDASARLPLPATTQASVDSGDAIPPDGNPGPGSALDAIRARMDAIRQVVRSWDRWTDAADTLLHERTERRADIDRLTGELEQVRGALERTTQELDAKSQALARLESAHAALLRDHEEFRRALADLRERHDALLLDREFAIDRVSRALQRLRP